MGATEAGGVVATTNWNNAVGAVRSTPQVLADETGTSTSAAIVWSANGIWMTPITDQPGTRRMMKGYLDTSNTSVTTLSVTGLVARDYDGRRRGERSHSRSPARTPWLLRTTTVRLTVQ